VLHAGAAVLRTVPTLLGVSVLVFLIMHAIPGDPAAIAAGLDASPETVAALRESLGLNRPLPEQFAAFLGRVVRGDLGTSIRTGRPVSAEIAVRLPYTVLLSVASVALAALVGVTAGVVAAVRHQRWIDHAVMTLTLAAVVGM